jgi:hypothetical protein
VAGTALLTGCVTVGIPMAMDFQMIGEINGCAKSTGTNVRLVQADNYVRFIPPEAAFEDTSFAECLRQHGYSYTGYRALMGFGFKGHWWVKKWL